MFSKTGTVTLIATNENKTDRDYDTGEEFKQLTTIYTVECTATIDTTAQLLLT